MPSPLLSILWNAWVMRSRRAADIGGLRATRNSLKEMVPLPSLSSSLKRASTSLGLRNTLKSCRPFLNSSMSIFLSPESSMMRNCRANPLIPCAPRWRHWWRSFSMGVMDMSKCSSGFYGSDCRRSVREAVASALRSGRIKTIRRNFLKASSPLVRSAWETSNTRPFSPSDAIFVPCVRLTKVLPMFLTDTLPAP
uniref:Uncharacterized protein n=1 Tax=Rhipicephalus microplus TaxID=6941 RepID=A0A6G5A3Z5_RHIMP